ncbi:hypothetical protein ASC92_20040 [Variovorax sp. Root411]|nr:hypothetical protein ASC92_20040 [Variovorax sp. Root411]
MAQDRPPPRPAAASRAFFLLLAAACAAMALPASAAGKPEAAAQQVALAAVASGDNRAAPFGVVDKRSARLFMFDSDGRLRASSPVLLGSAKGDDSVPGIGTRPIKDIRPEERTTPAGRFVTEPGVNASGEDVVWIDYDAAVSMHRVRTSNKSERRLERLASPSIEDNRISYGCINVPARFYNEQVKPVLGNRAGLVYVLPETASTERRFPFMDPNGKP